MWETGRSSFRRKIIGTEKRNPRRNAVVFGKLAKILELYGSKKIFTKNFVQRQKYKEKYKNIMYNKIKL